MEINLTTREFSLELKDEDIFSRRIPVCAIRFPNQTPLGALDENISEGYMGDLSLRVSDYAVQMYPTAIPSVGTQGASISNNLNIENVQGPGGDGGQFNPCILDVLGDGIVGVDDLERIYRSGQYPGIEYDLNDDGIVDESDYILAQEYIGYLCGFDPGDVDERLIIHLDASNPESYPGEGDVWYDISGKGNHFDLYGGPAQRYFAPDGGGSMYFGGSGYAELFLNGDFREDTYTYMVFVKQSPNPTSRRSIVGFSDSLAQGGEAAYFCHNLQHWNLGTPGQSVLNFYSSGNGYAATETFPSAGENFEYDQWHFICVTVSPDSARVVINDEVFDYEGNPATGPTRKNDFDRVWLATRDDPSNQNLVGYLANFRLYKRELSLDEISEIYNELKDKVVD